MVDSLNRGTCSGQAGQEIIIPCGPDVTEDGNTTFLYVSGGEIFANISKFLRKNLTIADDKVEIECHPMSSSSLQFARYTLNVTCKNFTYLL